MCSEDSLVIATDGLWNNVDKEAIGNQIRQAKSDSLSTMAKSLAEHAYILSLSLDNRCIVPSLNAV